ncbi:MAG: DegT/DnrJ/EryC1/StrS family aminotransferase [Mariprofundaceae bacterium]|nr:DegT/DnrJ/EryC1/StrS family aminotransferase [Mariprofundaceae bacterium]
MKVRYRNLSVQDPILKAELMDAVSKVLDHGFLLLGPELDELEHLVAKACDRKFAVGVSSGSEALAISMRALGIGPGDEVITTAFSWIATANSIAVIGATPVFVDIRDDFLIDPDLIEAAITPKTKAILPVQYTGQICDMDQIQAIADKHKLYVIEDGAQAYGATQNGKVCGSFGIASCFSANPMKVFNAYGEAGLITMDDEELYEQAKILRYAGTINKTDCVVPALNGRMDTLQAAMMLVSHKYLPQKVENRRLIAEKYRERLHGVVTCPDELEGNKHIYYAYSVLADRRDKLMAFLAEKGIETQVLHPVPMPHQTAYKQNGKISVPVAVRISQHILALPNQEDITDEEIHYVCDCVLEFYA